MEIGQLQKEINQNNREKGFWNDNHNVIQKMLELPVFTDREIAAVESAFKSQKLLLVVSEISEAIEADRKDRYASRIEPFNGDDYPNDEDFIKAFEALKKDTHEDEIADVAIRLLDYAEEKKTDLKTSIKDKQRYNALRIKMHGKKY